jgi:hypothetical protein
MGCNIQLVFYRPKATKRRKQNRATETAKMAERSDILVKALLNERETTLPIATDCWPYYRWEDLRRYYLDKIERFSKHEASK